MSTVLLTSQKAVFDSLITKILSYSTLQYRNFMIAMLVSGILLLADTLLFQRFFFKFLGFIC